MASWLRRPRKQSKQRTIPEITQTSPHSVKKIGLLEEIYLKLGHNNLVLVVSDATKNTTYCIVGILHHCIVADKQSATLLRLIKCVILPISNTGKCCHCLCRQICHHTLKPTRSIKSNKWHLNTFITSYLTLV